MKKIIIACKILKTKGTKCRFCGLMVVWFSSICVLLLYVGQTNSKHKIQTSQSYFLHSQENEGYTNYTIYNDNVIDCDSVQLKPPQLVNNRWQLTMDPSDSNNNLVTMGAYLDDRFHTDITKHSIMILVLTSDYAQYMQQVIPGSRVNLHCYAWYKNVSGPMYLNQVKMIKLDKWVFKVNGERRYQFSVTCASNTGINVQNKKPAYVSLTFHPCVIQHKIEIHHAIRQNYTGINGVCVPPLYGKWDDRETAALIEWIEILTMFGVKEINLYNVTLNSDDTLKKILSYYSLKGVVKLYQFPPPVDNYPLNSTYDVTQMAVRATVNDCLLRNIYSYEYALIIDKDEVIVPYLSTQYSDLFNHLLYNLPNADISTGFMFRSLDFYLDFQQANSSHVPDEDNILITSKYTEYTKASNRFKAVINPRLCLLAHNHECMYQVFWDSIRDKQVPIEIASVHHYRRTCSQGYGSTSGRKKQVNRSEDCREKIQGETYFNSHLMRFTERILNRVLLVLDNLSIDTSKLSHF